MYYECLCNYIQLKEPLPPEYVSYDWNCAANHYATEGSHMFTHRVS